MAINAAVSLCLLCLALGAGLATCSEPSRPLRKLLQDGAGAGDGSGTAYNNATTCFVPDDWHPYRTCRARDDVPTCTRGWQTFPDRGSCCRPGGAHPLGCSAPPDECWVIRAHWPLRQCFIDNTRCYQGHSVYNSSAACCAEGAAFAAGCSDPEPVGAPPPTETCWMPGSYWPLRRCDQETRLCVGAEYGKSKFSSQEECCQATFKTEGCSGPPPEDCWLPDMWWPGRTCRPPVDLRECLRGFETFPTEDECCSAVGPFGAGGCTSRVTPDPVPAPEAGAGVGAGSMGVPEGAGVGAGSMGVPEGAGAGAGSGAPPEEPEFEVEALFLGQGRGRGSGKKPPKKPKKPKRRPWWRRFPKWFRNWGTNEPDTQEAQTGGVLPPETNMTTGRRLLLARRLLDGGNALHDPATNTTMTMIDPYTDQEYEVLIVDDEDEAEAPDTSESSP